MAVAILILALQWVPPAAMPGDDEFPPGNRYAEVMAAPPLSDLDRFPPREAITQARRFNAAFRRNLEAERELWPWNQQPVFDAALSDASALYAAWDKLDDLRAYYAVPWWRQRLRLAELRALIGDDAYAAGAMPPAVPVWFFRDLK